MGSKLKPLGWLSGALAILLLGWFFLNPGATSHSQQGQEPPPMPVELLTLQSTTIEDTSDYLATTESRQSAFLQPKVSGYVERIYKKPGEYVQQGTPILAIDASQQQAQFSQFEAAVASAQADVESAEKSLVSLQAQEKGVDAELAFAEKQYARYRRLIAKKAVSQKDFEDVETQYHLTKARLAQVDSDIAAQQARANQAKTRYTEAQFLKDREQATLNDFTVRAPFHGVVGDISVKVGDYVSPSTSLTHVTDISQLDIEVSIPADKSSQLQTGDPIRLLTEQLTPIGEAALFFIDPKVDTASQTVLVRARFDNQTAQLRDAQRLRARLIWSTREGVTVPTQAVQRMGDKRFVYLAKPADSDTYTVSQQPVVLGPIQGDDYAIQSGVSVGDTVVVSGTMMLSDGAKVSEKQPREQASGTPEEPAS